MKKKLLVMLGAALFATTTSTFLTIAHAYTVTATIGISAHGHKKHKQSKKKHSVKKTKKQKKAVNKPINQADINAAKQVALDQINKERQSRGISPYTFNATLSNVADQRAQQITTSFSHVDDNGNFIAMDLASTQGYQISEIAENIGMDYLRTSLNSAVLNDIHEMMYNDAASNWGHRDNFLNSEMNEIGIGISVKSNGYVYVAYDMGSQN